MRAYIRGVRREDRRAVAASGMRRRSKLSRFARCHGASAPRRSTIKGGNPTTQRRLPSLPPDERAVRVAAAATAAARRRARCARFTALVEPNYHKFRTIGAPVRVFARGGSARVVR